MVANGYSFLTKSAKIKLDKARQYDINGYSFLTKSAKIKPLIVYRLEQQSYSFLTKSAKIKPNRRAIQDALKL